MSESEIQKDKDVIFQLSPAIAQYLLAWSLPESAGASLHPAKQPVSKTSRSHGKSNPK